MTVGHYSGAGNTFFLVDQREEKTLHQQISSICEKGGVDGMILVENSSIADVRMRTFNRDGTEAEMCGNGLRCLIQFLADLKIVRETYKIETVAGIQYGWLEEGEVCVQLAPPKDINLNLPHHLHFINTGVPHVICFVKEIESVDVSREGKKLRETFNANADFVSLEEEGVIAVRTYERGVEEETLACGTGAAASALVTSKIYELPSPITVKVRSGEELKIIFSDDGSRVILKGPVVRLNQNFEICFKHGNNYTVAR